MLATPNGGYLPPEPSTADRPVPLSVRNRSTGHIVIGDGAGRVVQTDSHLEMKVALVLLARPDVVRLEEQVLFPWRDARGKPKKHYFDFRLRMVSGRRVAVAVKPAKVIAKGRELPKLRTIAAQVTPAFADEVRLFTDRDIDPVDLKNAALFHAYRAPDAEADARARAMTHDLIGAATLVDLTTEAGLGPRGYRAFIRLIRAGDLTPMRHEVLTPETLVRVGEVGR